jgi:hypothetical protein
MPTNAVANALLSLCRQATCAEVMERRLSAYIVRGKPEDWCKCDEKTGQEQVQ